MNDESTETITVEGYVQLKEIYEAPKDRRYFIVLNLSTRIEDSPFTNFFQYTQIELQITEEKCQELKNVLKDSTPSSHLIIPTTNLEILVKK